MTTTIAVSGKGGSGKTTIASMIVRTLLERREHGPILCIDADPNACLALALGAPPGLTVADLREQARAKGSPNAKNSVWGPVSPNAGGMDRVHLVEYGFQQAITEADGFDLVTMGRPEGPSCYCAVNNLLRRILDELSSKYRLVVIDNEAGMEHLSRRTTNHVDWLCLVSEPTAVGALTARRIHALARQLPIVVKEIGLVWNKADGNCPLMEELKILARVPEDARVLGASRRGDNVFALPEEALAFQAVRTMVRESLMLDV